MSKAGSTNTCATPVDSAAQARTRGMANKTVSQPGFKSFETYAPPSSPAIRSPTPDSSLQPDASPAPQTRTADSLMSSLHLEPPPPQPDKRIRFIDRFSNDEWNYPGREYPEMGTALITLKALVIAINYGLSNDALPATYVDAYSIVDMLESKFRYPPRCIRVLADLVNQSNAKDDRWPNKENIEKGIKWLTEDTGVGSRRFLFFAGHGLKFGDEGWAEEGIVPRDYLSYVPFTEQHKTNPRQVPDKSTVLLDAEINKHLVDGLADGTKLTVIFDVNLPVKIGLGDSRPTKALERAGPQVIPAVADVGQTEFKAFSEHCEVISWCACDESQLAHEDGQGGKFTNAFIQGLGDPQRADGINTYRRLNRYILDEFLEHNKKVDEDEVSEAGSETEVEDFIQITGTSAEKISQSQNSSRHQAPKLYVSECIADQFADKVVVI
ncbi:ICE-like protease (caspase) p20 domain protein [Ceratobasidium sp. AG-Ba]|nr:ICE-like protease (caspase) p20 domain protein [Ceratobasidium sp. AG-Ba]